MRNEACWKENEKCLLSLNHPFRKKGGARSKSEMDRPVRHHHVPVPLEEPADPIGAVGFPPEVQLQLQVLGEQINVPVFSIPGGLPLEICKRGLAHAKKLKCDTIIYDTAGRLAIDERLMKELDEIRTAVDPQNVFLVVDAMIGQDSVKTAKSFHDLLGLSGVILTKLDGDARGGAAISIKNVTGTAVKYVPIGDRVEVNVGRDTDITMIRRLKDQRVDNVIAAAKNISP